MGSAENIEIAATLYIKKPTSYSPPLHLSQSEKLLEKNMGTRKRLKI